MAVEEQEQQQEQQDQERERYLGQIRRANAFKKKVSTGASAAKKIQEAQKVVQYWKWIVGGGGCCTSCSFWIFLVLAVIMIVIVTEYGQQAAEAALRVLCFGAGICFF